VFPFGQIHKFIGGAQREILNKRLAEAEKPTDKTLFDEEVKRLSKGIHEAFNLCCPVEGCGFGLDRIEGCNAAKCSNEECNAYFCYLCGDTQEDNQEAHQHVREVHSNNAWEHRAGYTARYHWLLIRKALAYLFKGKIDPAVRESILNSQKKFLEEKNMWPFPAGLMTTKWLEQVKNSQLTPEKKIELLQNEAIFHRQESVLPKHVGVVQKQKIKLLDTEISHLGGLVLASLDVGDAGGINLPGSHEQAAQPPVAAPAAVQAGLQENEVRVYPPFAAVRHMFVQAAQPPVAVPAAAQAGLQEMLDDHRVNPPFAALGNMYESGGLIWSGVAPQTLNWEQAINYCAALGGGARLPTADEYRALKRAMSPGGRYDANQLPDTIGTWFWSSSPHGDDNALVMFGGNGNVDNFPRNYFGSVRCVRAAAGM
jgi:hypothetical protein